MLDIVVEAAGVGLFGVLTGRKLLIPGTATRAKTAPLPDPLYVYCTKTLFPPRSNQRPSQAEYPTVCVSLERELPRPNINPQQCD